MKALLLVGGEGTRLRPLTESVPKPILPLAGRPHVLHMIDWLGRHGIEEVVLACGFRAEAMRAGLAGFTGASLTFVDEPEPLGTAGAIRFAAEHLDERFLVLNGDILADLDLSALIAHHERARARATIALHPVAEPAGYGLVRRREDGQVTGFLEKPAPDEIDTDEINAGAYVLERSVLELIEPGRSVSIEREIFPALIGAGLHGVRLPGYWIDIGTPERFIRANGDLLEGRIRTDLGDRVAEAGSLIAADAGVDETALISDPVVVGARSVVGARAAVIGPAVVGSGSRVGADASLTGSILFDDCEIGDGATVGRAILAHGAAVAAGAEVADDEVLGAGEGS